jgi:hypothetical protein
MTKRVLPRLDNFASVRQIKRKIKGSEVIYKNRDALASELINIGTANISDVVTWDNGLAKVKDVKDIPEHALSAIKRIRILKDGTLDIEMVDKVRRYTIGKYPIISLKDARKLTIKKLKEIIYDT